MKVWITYRYAWASDGIEIDRVFASEAAARRRAEANTTGLSMMHFDGYEVQEDER